MKLFCRYYEHWLLPYASGLLSEKHSRLSWHVEHHIEYCEHCRGKVASLRAVDERLHRHTRALRISRRLDGTGERGRGGVSMSNRVLQAIQPDEPRTTSIRWSPSTLSFVSVAAFTAVMVIVINPESGARGWLANMLHPQPPAVVAPVKPAKPPYMPHDPFQPTLVTAPPAVATSAAAADSDQSVQNSTPVAITPPTIARISNSVATHNTPPVNDVSTRPVAQKQTTPSPSVADYWTAGKVQAGPATSSAIDAPAEEPRPAVTVINGHQADARSSPIENFAAQDTAENRVQFPAAGRSNNAPVPVASEDATSAGPRSTNYYNGIVPQSVLPPGPPGSFVGIQTQAATNVSGPRAVDSYRAGAGPLSSMVIGGVFGSQRAAAKKFSAPLAKAELAKPDQSTTTSTNPLVSQPTH